MTRDCLSSQWWVPPANKDSVDSLARSGRYLLRALTRRLDTALAQQWRDAGVEVRAVGLQPGMQRDLTAALPVPTGLF
jgi:hypothetical protein